MANSDHGIGSATNQQELRKDSLKGEVAVVTGAGRGIGYEAARALLWLGANIAVAEVDEESGKAAARSLANEQGTTGSSSSRRTLVARLKLKIYRAKS